MGEELCGRPAYIKVDLEAFKHNWDLHKNILQDHGCDKAGIYMHLDTTENIFIKKYVITII